MSTKVAQAGVNAGVKTAITGGSFKDNLISEAGSIAFNTIGHDLYNNSEYKDILPPKSVVQGLVGGALAKLQGGDFAAGAISTATSHVVSEYMLNSIIENFDPENPPFDINDKEAALKYAEQLKTQVTAISSLVGTIVTKAVKPDISDQDLINSNDIAQNAVENNAVFLAGSIILALTLYANTPDVKEEPKTGLPNSALNHALDGAVFAYDVTKELIDGGVPTEAILIALGHKLHISKSAAKKIVDDVKVGKSGINYINKLKQKVNTADIGDIVRTPTSNIEDFEKVRGTNMFKNKYTGEIWSKSYTTHLSDAEWKVGLGKNTTPSFTQKITIDAQTGQIIKIDK